MRFAPSFEMRNFLSDMTVFSKVGPPEPEPETMIHRRLVRQLRTSTPTAG
jgi:hypothetical protein